MKKMQRTAAVELWPGWIIPYLWATFMFRSAMIGKGICDPHLLPDVMHPCKVCGDAVH